MATGKQIRIARVLADWDAKDLAERTGLSKESILNIERGTFRPEGCIPVGWSSDGKTLLIYNPGDLPAKVEHLNLATGQLQPWKSLMPADAAGVTDLGPILITPDGKSYVYEYGRTLSDLYLVEGIR